MQTFPSGWVRTGKKVSVTKFPTVDSHDRTGTVTLPPDATHIIVKLVHPI